MAWKNDTIMSEFILLGLSSQPCTQILLFVVFCLVYWISVTGNGFIIMVFMTTKRLQTPMYFLLLNLSFMDICLSSTTVPRALKDMISERKTISYAECAAQMYISLSLGENEAVLLGIMAYDRYIAICCPLHYTRIITRLLCIKLAAAVWICGFIISIPTVLLTFSVDLCGHNEINHFYCEQPEMLSLACENIKVVELVIFGSCTIVAMIPFIFIFVSYIKVIVNILSSRFSVRTKRAFSTCGSHLVVVTLYYGSGLAAYMKPRSSASTDIDKVMSVFYSAVTPMLNPLIYTLRNNEVKAALWQLLLKFC